VLAAGKTLRIELPRPATIHWSDDHWQRVTDTPTQLTAFGTHLADLDTEGLAPGDAVVLTFFWQNDQRWEGTDYRIDVI
jgi:glucoamylase